MNDFVLLEHSPGSMFSWLQCVDKPELAFVVIDPLQLNPEYPKDLLRRSVGFLELEEDEELCVLGICTFPPAPAAPTVNLLAPIGVGMSSRKAAQVVLHETGYGPRHEFLPQAP